MSNFDPSTLIGGPCLVSYAGQVMYTEGDVEIEFVPETVERAISGYQSARYVTEMTAVIRFTPHVVTYEALDVLLPYRSTAIGARVYGATDKVCYVQSLTESRRYTFHRCAVTRMPALNFSMVNPLVGAVEITAITDQGTEVGEADSIFTFSATANADTSFRFLSSVNEEYSLAIGTAVGFDNVALREGLQVDWDLSLEPITLDAHGLVDMRMTGLAARLSFVAEGIADANLHNIDQIVNGAIYQDRGRLLSPITANKNLIITSESTLLFDTFTFNNVVIARSSRRFGVTTPAFAYEGVTQPDIATGVAAPVFEIAEP